MNKRTREKMIVKLLEVGFHLEEIAYMTDQEVKDGYDFAVEQEETKE
jgi:hypothetical protein